MYLTITMLLLLAGDVETCPGPGCRCCCGKNVKLEQSTGVCIARMGKCHFRCLVDKLQYGGERLFSERCLQYATENYVGNYKELCDFLKTRGLKIFH